jgi:enoyl-CoA hydratase
VTTVILNRPDVRNAVNPQAASELLAAFDAFEADENASVAVLTGAGGHFCAGYDLKALSGDAIPYEPEGDGLMGPIPPPAEQAYHRSGRGLCRRGRA